MTTRTSSFSQLKEEIFSSKTSQLDEYLEKLIQVTLFKQRKILKSYLFSHFFFWCLITLEVILFGCFFSSLSQSTILAFSLSALFLTTFSYCILFFYFQTKKTDGLTDLFEHFKEDLHTCIPYEKNTEEYREIILPALHRLLSQLQFSLDSLPPLLKKFPTISHLIMKISIWSQWKDLLKVKERLLHYCVQVHLEWLKLDPLLLEVHMSLANHYQLLSKLYHDNNPSVSWLPEGYYSEEMQSKHTQALNQAIEEYQILKDLDPHNAWIHAKLAKIYQELNKTEEEVSEYEKILSLSPQDQAALYRLGILYFQLGKYAKGLKIYKELNMISASQAQELLTHYIESKEVLFLT